MDANKLTVMGKVTYKQVVTQAYKDKALAEVDEQIKQIDDELANFDKQMDKTMTELTLKAHPQVEQLRQQFNMERQKIAVYREQMEASKAAVDALQEGEEVTAGEGNFVTELVEGEAFNLNLNREIVVKDDIVVKIRQING
ncbi:YlqD family protein [Peptococcus simiae]|uniref:YlqD family protein n=1 Tax=Peptococcus simiae TaxID=1643805 RepID=A0ABW9GYY4_9FIRM